MMKRKKRSGRTQVSADRVSPTEVNLKISAVGEHRWRRQPKGGAVWTTSELLDTPGEGWDAWFEDAYRLVPEAASAVEQVVALISGCTWVPNREDEESLTMLSDFISRPTIMLSGAMNQAIWNYYTYGRCFIQAHQLKRNDPTSIDVLKVPDPRTIRVCRDNEQDYAELQAASKASKTTLGAIKNPTAHTGKIIGYIQASTIGTLTTGQPAQLQAASVPLAFKAEDLIFIPRATPAWPNGISILQNEYKACINIAGAEEMMARATRIYSNPPWYIKVGSQEFPCQPNASGQAMVDFVKAQLGALAEAGEVENITSLVLPNWAEFTLPVFNIPIANVVIDHLYKQINWLLTGIGIPPAIMSAEGFRATAQEALRFMEDRINPIRERFQAEVTARIILPYLTAMHGGNPPGTSWYMPQWSWRDITPGDLDRVRETLVQAHGGPFMSKNEARNIHGGLAPMPEDSWNDPGKGMVDTGSPPGKPIPKQDQSKQPQEKPVKQDLVNPEKQPKNLL